MPRHNRSSRPRAKAGAGQSRPLRDGAGWVRTEYASDGDWLVRDIPGSQSTKYYRCPGCDQEITPGTPHVVAWRDGSVDDRRHWHNGCWTARHRRGPTSRRW